MRILDTMDIASLLAACIDERLTDSDRLAARRVVLERLPSWNGGDLLSLDEDQRRELHKIVSQPLMRESAA